jgi:hypothetical protein
VILPRATKPSTNQLRLRVKALSSPDLRPTFFPILKPSAKSLTHLHWPPPPSPRGQLTSKTPHRRICSSHADLQSLPSRTLLRQSRFLLRRINNTFRTASTTSEAASKAKETASGTASKASEGLSRVSSSAGNIVSGAASGARNALGKVGGRTGRLISFVDCERIPCYLWEGLL